MVIQLVELAGSNRSLGGSPTLQLCCRNHLNTQDQGGYYHNSPFGTFSDTATVLQSHTISIKSDKPSGKDPGKVQIIPGVPVPEFNKDKSQTI